MLRLLLLVPVFVAASPPLLLEATIPCALGSDGADNWGYEEKLLDVLVAFSADYCPEEHLNPIFASGCAIFLASRPCSYGEVQSVRLIPVEGKPKNTREFQVHQFRVVLSAGEQLWEASFDSDGDVIYMDFEDYKCE